MTRKSLLERWHAWLRKHSLRLLAIRDTPEAIAGGVAIGVFFGFTPLFGLKTLSAIFLAWLTGSNILAAVIAGAIHDVFLPFMPVIYLAEYKVGYWLLSFPHNLPSAIPKPEWSPHQWHSWTAVLTVGKPTLLGSAVCGIPAALVTFWITRRIVARHQRKKHAPKLLMDRQP